MRKRAVDTESIAIASVSLVNNLLHALVQSGALSEKDALSIYDTAIQEQSNMNAAPNQSAAYLLQELRVAALSEFDGRREEG